MHGLLNAHRSEQVTETRWVWRLVNQQKTASRASIGSGEGVNTVLFCETILLYVPARLSIGVLFLKLTSQRGAYVRTCVRGERQS